MSKLGDDYFGRITREILTATGAWVVMSVSPEFSSSYTIALNREDADRIFLHHSGANDYFYTSDLDLEIIKEAKVFHFGYPPLMRSFYLNHAIIVVRRRLRYFSKNHKILLIPSFSTILTSDFGLF